MSQPGFTADASLQPAIGRYVSGTASAPIRPGVIPSLKKKIVFSDSCFEGCMTVCKGLQWGEFSCINYCVNSCVSTA